MSRLADLIAELCPDGVKYKPLSECVVLPSIPRGLKRGQYESSGTYPIVDQGRGQVAGYSSDETKLVKDIPGIVFGDHTREIKYVDHFFVPGADGVKWIRAVDDVDIRYLFHSLSSLAIPSRGYNRHWNVVREMSIPVPPLEVQREIVRILDQFTALEAELEAELEARRPQYEHYRNHLLSYDSLAARGPVNVIELRDVGVVRMCKRIHKAETSVQGDIPFFKISTFGGTPTSFISAELYEKYKEKYPYPKQGDLLISAAGTIGQIVRFDGADAYFQDSNIVWLEHDESIVLNRYLYFVYLNTRWTTDGGTIKRLYNNRILQQQICVPPIETQIAIADLLDRFDALVNDISLGLPAEIAARRAQYEHYRDRLLSFPEKVVSRSNAS